MRYKNLGRTGLKVSEACLGTNMFGSRADEAMSRAMVDVAVEHGVNFFDTADIYSHGVSEELLGRALHG
ncbi:MAG: aldo/keto reductase, partial [Chloroflexi bacterium]|nr:aldo/keto reductase [Chloroflexota bacterium]